MENITIALIILVITIILFSSISYSYGSPSTYSKAPVFMFNSGNNPQYYSSPNINTTNTVGRVNPKALPFSIFNLPEKDEYMSAELRNQVDMLRTQFYYDNCQGQLI
jgi:hypothetical protein